MFYLVKVLIGRAIVALDRPFSYYSEDETITQGMRVMVSFGSSKETIGFVIEKPQTINMTIEEYEEKEEIHLAKIIRKVDDEPLLDDDLLLLAKNIANYYQSDLIRVFNSMLPPSLKPKNSALNKPQGKFVDFIFANPYNSSLLSKNEAVLYTKIQSSENGLRASKITAKKSLESLLKKNALFIQSIPVSRIPEIEASEMIPFDLTIEQNKAYEAIYHGKEKETFLLQGVTGSGKTEIYIKLAESYLKENKGVLILIPEIALTDHMANVFASHFKDTISILNSSLGDSRKYDEYKRILSGESKVVLGTRSAVFAPVQDLGIIIIDEEHSNSYKQDNVPYYDAIKVAQMRAEIQGCKVVLGSATPRVIDKARASHNLYTPIYLNTRYSKNQEKELIIVDMNHSDVLDAKVSSLISIPLQEEINKTLARHEQVMILINRRGYSPTYTCRKCHTTAKCPNCNIPLSLHKRDNTLRCHHCGYHVNSYNYRCECGGEDFFSLGYGTERAYEELKMLYPLAKITRLDSDISSNEVRHEVLQSFADGETDIIVGTQVIAKGHDFPRVTLAAMLDADSSLRLPTYLANEETFDLISQFVGRAGRKDLKGRVLLQTYVPDNQVIQLAAKQDYETFYKLEMEERKRYQYPPYTYLAQITIKAMDSAYAQKVGDKVREYLLSAIGNKRFNVYGPTAPYIPHINGRYYRNILIKYKSPEEANEIFRGLKTIRLANKDAEILVNIDPGNEGI